MKKIKLYAQLSLAALLIVGCKYDDSELRNDVNDLKSRVEKLETWCATTNTQISALQGVVTALEENDYVTGVTPILEGSTEIGYTITFTKSNPITIMHGKNGADGTNGITPILGVKQDVDGLYYWTVKIGDANAEWMTGKDGEKIRTTGDKGDVGNPGQDGNDGHSPVISVGEFEGILYWKIDNQWLIQDGAKVPATGEKGNNGDKGEAGADGDAIFAKGGIDYTSDPSNVIFTLADGVTKITLPRATALSIGFDSYELFYVSDVNNEITLILPSTLKESDYMAITATVTNGNGTGMDVQTRSAATNNVWGVMVTKPTFFNDKVVEGSAKVTLTPPATVSLSETAILKVSILDKDGKESVISRPVKYSGGSMIECTPGQLQNIVGDLTVKELAIKGSMNASDFTFIKESLTALEVLDLSMTDLTSIPSRALRYNSLNTTLKKVILPETITSIEYAGFANCGALSAIDVKNCVTIGEFAFENCASLQEVKLGQKLQIIVDKAFINCTSLRSINIPANVQTLGVAVFRNCTNLETVTLNEGLQNLSPSTFYNCGIISITIPTTVTVIPKWTFEECNRLENIYLHNNITSIGGGAFLRCRLLKRITIPTGVTVIENNLFDECSSLQFVTFHDGITEIGERAFAYCTNLRTEGISSMKLPEELVTLGDGAFQSSGVTSVDMLNTKVTVLPSDLFHDCTQLTSLNLPSNLIEIKQWALYGTALYGIQLPASLKSLENYVFFECKQLKSVISTATTAPTIQNETFDKNFKTGRKLTIPKNSDYSLWTDHFEKVNSVL